MLQMRVLEPQPIPEAEESASYDAMVRRHRGLLNLPFVKFVQHIGLERGRVLDIGTGPGWIPIELATRQPGWEIWGLDASADMLALAERHASATGVADRVRFVAGDATALPFDDGMFDLVISHFTLHHVDRPEQLFNEAARVVRGGGKVVIKDLRRPPRWKAALLVAFSRYVLGQTTSQLQMYRDSLAAALSLGEVATALKASKLAMAQVRGSRGLYYVITS